MRFRFIFGILRAMSDYQTRDLTRQVAALLRAEMARHGVSQQEMAVAAGVTQSQLSKMVRGMRAITIDQLYAMAWALDLDPVEVVATAHRNMAEYDIPAPGPVSYVSEGIRMREPHFYEDWHDREPITPVGPSRARNVSAPAEDLHTVDLSAEEFELAASDDDTLIDPDRGHA